MTYIKLTIPYEQREWAKNNKALWNRELKSWVIPFRRYYNQEWIEILHYIDTEPLPFTLYSPYFYLLQSEKICYQCNRATPLYGIHINSGYLLETVQVLTKDGSILAHGITDLKDHHLGQHLIGNNIYCINDDAKTIISHLTNQSFMGKDQNPPYINRCIYPECNTKQGIIPIQLSHTRVFSTSRCSFHKINTPIQLHTDIEINTEIQL